MTRGREQEPERTMSREQWMAHLLEQAPEITVEQWAETVAALEALRPLRGKASVDDRDMQPPA